MRPYFSSLPVIIKTEAARAVDTARCECGAAHPHRRVSRGLSCRALQPPGPGSQPLGLGAGTLSLPSLPCCLCPVPGACARPRLALLCGDRVQAVAGLCMSQLQSPRACSLVCGARPHVTLFTLAAPVAGGAGLRGTPEAGRTTQRVRVPGAAGTQCRGRGVSKVESRLSRSPGGCTRGHAAADLPPVGALRVGCGLSPAASGFLRVPWPAEASP